MLYDNLEATRCREFAIVKEATRKVDKNADAMVCANSHCKEEISMIVSMFLFLFYYALYIFATGKRVNHGGDYGLEIPANFYFHESKKAIKLAKNKTTKMKENLNKTVKHCLK